MKTNQVRWGLGFILTFFMSATFAAAVQGSMPVSATNYSEVSLSILNGQTGITLSPFRPANTSLSIVVRLLLDGSVTVDVPSRVTPTPPPLTATIAAALVSGQPNAQVTISYSGSFDTANNKSFLYLTRNATGTQSPVGIRILAAAYPHGTLPPAGASGGTIGASRTTAVTLDATGQADLYMGGNFTVNNPNTTPKGTYSGSFTITAAYT